jgi:hypothetical protein
MQVSYGVLGKKFCKFELKLKKSEAQQNFMNLSL